MQKEVSPLASHQIEPELLAPAPRSVRLRMVVVNATRVRVKLASSLLGLLMLATISLATITSLPNWFGQVIQARVTYQGNVFYFADRRGQAPYPLQKAQIVYEQGELHRKETITVSAGLAESFPEGSRVPIKVLHPWQTRTWTSQDISRARCFLRSFWAAMLVVMIPYLLLLGILYRLARPDNSKRWQRLVREGIPVAGRLTGVHMTTGSGPVDKPSRFGTAIVRFAYVDPTAWNMPHPEDSMLGGTQTIHGTLATLLPPVGQTVTVLLPPSRFMRPRLYLLEPFEAVNPTFSSTPAPKTG